MLARRVAASYLLSGAAFVAIQGALAAYNSRLVRQAVEAGFLGGVEPASLRDRVATAVVTNTVLFVALAITHVALVTRRPGVLWSTPAVLFIITPLIADPHELGRLGTEWALACFAPCADVWFAHPWVGGIVDLVLVLLPGVLWTARLERKAPRRAPDPPTVTGIAAAVALVAVALRVSGALGTTPSAAPFLAAAAFGLLCGVDTARWPWAHILFAVVVGGTLLQGLQAMGLTTLSRFGNSGTLSDVWILPTAALLGSLWEPIAAGLRLLRARPLMMFVVVNGLNVADAVLTRLAVGSGLATELNPLVRAGGLTLKIASVTVLSWIMLRRRPEALIWPIAALGSVVAYHVAGLAFITP